MNTEVDDKWTGLLDTKGRKICAGDIVFWDDESNGEWSRIAKVVYDKPTLVFRVIASPYEGIIGKEFNFGSFIWTDTEKYLTVVDSAEEGLEIAAKLRDEQPTNKDNKMVKIIMTKTIQENAIKAAKAEAPHLASYIDEQAGKGHNSTTNYGGITGEHLRQYIERIERLEEDKKVIAQDIKEIFGEAKANGFDVKIMRKVISLRKMDAADREEQEAIMDLYLQALGMTPLEKAIAEAE